MSLNDLPYLFLDCETTGTDPYTDRIVSIALVEFPAGHAFHSLVNPGRPIPVEASEVHGIRDEDVREAPAFSELADMVQKSLDAAIPVTYNGRRFDIPLIDTELRRAGRSGFPRDEIGRIVAPEIDIYQVLIKSEPRDLVSVVKRFLDRDLEDAHSADADTAVLPDLLEAICEAFGLDPDDAEALCTLTRPEDEIDRAGKFRKNEDGVVVFAFGKHKDRPVRDHLDYVEWILGKDFPPETKDVGRYLLRHHGGHEQGSLL